MMRLMNIYPIGTEWIFSMYLNLIFILLTYLCIYPHIYVLRLAFQLKKIPYSISMQVIMIPLRKTDECIFQKLGIENPLLEKFCRFDVADFNPIGCTRETSSLLRISSFIIIFTSCALQSRIFNSCERIFFFNFNNSVKFTHFEMKGKKWVACLYQW